MANVEPYVQQIRSAVYGEQVRESIARSIEEMNQDNIDTQEYYDTTIESANAAITNANNAATGATNIKNEVEQKLADGDFDGPQGPQGSAATISVGTVQTGQPGTAAQVTNSGTSSDAVLNFIIPRGATGEIENLDTASVTFGLDNVYQNIASGMTITQLFSRIQLLLDAILLTDTELDTIRNKLGLSDGKLYAILNKMAGYVVVDVGTSNGWTYVKYANGRMRAKKAVTTGSAWTQVVTGIYYNQVSMTLPSGMTFYAGYASPTVKSQYLTGAQVQKDGSNATLTIHRLSGSENTFTYNVVIEGTY